MAGPNIVRRGDLVKTLDTFFVFNVVSESPRTFRLPTGSIIVPMRMAKPGWWECLWGIEVIEVFEGDIKYGTSKSLLV